jgi:hypothetical protein
VGVSLDGPSRRYAYTALEQGWEAPNGSSDSLPPTMTLSKQMDPEGRGWDVVLGLRMGQVDRGLIRRVRVRFEQAGRAHTVTVPLAVEICQGPATTPCEDVHLERWLG